MLVPRENRLVRIYCQLKELPRGSSRSNERHKITLDMVLKAAQQILAPYTLDYKHCEWWTVYQVYRLSVLFGPSPAL